MTRVHLLLPTESGALLGCVWAVAGELKVIVKTKMKKASLGKKILSLKLQENSPLSQCFGYS